MKKKFLAPTILILAVITILGVTATIIIAKNNDSQTENNSSEIANEGDEIGSSSEQNNFAITGMLDSNFDASDITAMFEHADYVALVHVDSIDGADNYAEVIDQPVRIFTYGQFTVIDSFKGDLEIGKTTNFYRVGGTMSVDDYCKHASESRCSKMEALDPEKDNVSYVVSGDIDIEAGKVYLAYLQKDEALRTTEGYTFQENQGGLREVQSSANYSADSDPSDIKILNNFTGDWESLSSIIPQE